VRLKGVGVKNSLIALEKLYGQEATARVKNAMPARLREMIDGVLPLEWYPVEMTAALHVAIRDVLGTGGWEVSQRISGEAARIEIAGVYRLLVRAVQYDTVWDRMERAWRLYYDAGEVKWIDREAGHATAIIAGVAGFNTGMWYSVLGRVEQLLLASGARSVNVSIVESTSTHARIEALWLE
jgi:hypothetical protein